MKWQGVIEGASTWLLVVVGWVVVGRWWWIQMAAWAGSFRQHSQRQETHAILTCPNLTIQSTHERNTGHYVNSASRCHFLVHQFIALGKIDIKMRRAIKIRQVETFSISRDLRVLVTCMTKTDHWWMDLCRLYLKHLWPLRLLISRQLSPKKFASGTEKKGSFPFRRHIPIF